MFNLTAIAAKFNVAESAIVRVEEWSKVVFAVIKGIGARFIKKTVGLQQVIKPKTRRNSAPAPSIKNNSPKNKAMKLEPVSTIQGMWNGQVFVNMLGFERVHIGLKGADRIRNGESPLVILSEVLQVPQNAILGVKSDRARKTVKGPFER